MEALFRGDDMLQERLLLVCGDDLVLSVISLWLILREVFAQHPDELAKRQTIVLLEVKELLGEDLVIVLVRPVAVDVQDRIDPRARDLGSLVRASAFLPAAGSLAGLRASAFFGAALTAGDRW